MAGISTILNPLFAFYDVLFQPILALGPYMSLFIFSTALALLFSVLYWLFLDIERADRIKEKINKYQERMKEAREEDKQEKASKHFKKTLKLNQKFMMLNLKPMVATMVFVGLIFPWLGATYAPTVQMDRVNSTSYTGNMTFAGQQETVKAFNQSTVTYKVDNRTFTEDIEAFNLKWQVTKFERKAEGAELGLNGRFVDLPFSIPLAGEAFNWLGFYILVIMPMTYIFRKLLGVQ